MKVLPTLLKPFLRLFPFRSVYHCSFHTELKVLSSLVIVHLVTIVADLPVPVALLYGPVLYRMYRSVTEDKRLEARDYHLHQLPFYVLLALGQVDQELYHVFYLPAMPVSLLAYTAGILRVRRRVLLQVYTDEVHLIQLLVLISLAVSVPLLMFASRLYMKLDWGFSVQQLSVYILILSVLIMGGFLAVKRRQAKEQKSESEDIDSGAESAEENSLKLTAMLRQRKLYLDPMISLEKFAVEAGVSRHKCSKQLQMESGKSFYQLIAEYRIDHARNLLKQDVHNELTIEGIAEACGFNSKASFNRYFKDMCGCTPSEYRRQFSKVLDV
ncbi:MAG: helix-turn-helix domain-containing protein [Arcticibacter sp.]